MIIGGKQFDTEHETYLMGILNRTPDSFSDGGHYQDLDQALFRAEEMIAQGADILDIGGESTRPGHICVSVQEEIDRVAPLLEALKHRFDVPLSLDSYKREVIEANLPYIDLVNDIWGLRRDPDMATLIAKSKLPCCLMHNRATHDYTSFFDDVLSDLRDTLYIAKTAGIADEAIILDPGIGFQKNTEENLVLLHRMDQLRALGYPVLLGLSRKSVIGQVLGRPVDQRLSGTLAGTVMAVMQGATFIRVHDVLENLDAIRMTKAIMKETTWTKSK